jgi:hypothetical protein
MLAEMTADQLQEWKAFAAEEPFGFDALADLFAILTATVANAAPFRSGEGVSFEKVRFRPGKPRPPEPADGPILSGAETVGPDLSKPIPDDD